MKTTLLPSFATLAGLLRGRLFLHLEILALRQQLAMMQRAAPKRLRFRPWERLFWVVLYRMWPDCLTKLMVINPDTLVRWHRKGFRLYRIWKSRRGRGGRPRVAPEVRELIRTMSRENVGWGALRIHGELKMLGIPISQATVGKYMNRPRKPPSPTWRTFLNNHTEPLTSVDFFAVPTATSRILYVLGVLNHDRRRVVHFNVTEHSTAAWTAQQMVEAFPFDSAPRYLLRDRDRTYGDKCRSRVHGQGIKEVHIAPRSP